MAPQELAEVQELPVPVAQMEPMVLAALQVQAGLQAQAVRRVQVEPAVQAEPVARRARLICGKVLGRLQPLTLQMSASSRMAIVTYR